ncbi:MAG: hypothetical protein ABSC92_00770 [Rhizomicrobium sp.]
MSVFPAHRFAAATGVVLLHVGIIAALLSALHKLPPIVTSSREHIVWFALAPKPVKRTATPVTPRARAVLSPLRYPDYRTVNLPPITGGTDLGALHGFLFECAPQNLINLTPEQRAECVTANAGHAPDDSVDYADHTDRSKNAVRWARGLMRKQQPALLPCMPPLNPIVSLICLGKGITGGFDLDMQPGYGDTPQEVHVPNNGDPPTPGPPS